MPISFIAGGERVHFPIEFFQYALGCNDLYLPEGGAEYLEALRAYAGWAASSQRPDGSWDAFCPKGSEKYMVPSIAQAKGASTLLRVTLLLCEPGYECHARPSSTSCCVSRPREVSSSWRSIHRSRTARP